MHVCSLNCFQWLDRSVSIDPCCAWLTNLDCMDIQADLNIHWKHKVIHVCLHVWDVQSRSHVGVGIHKCACTVLEKFTYLLSMMSAFCCRTSKNFVFCVNNWNYHSFGNVGQVEISSIFQFCFICQAFDMMVKHLLRQAFLSCYINMHIVVGQWSVEEPKDTGLEGDLALVLKVIERV